MNINKSYNSIEKISEQIFNPIKENYIVETPVESPKIE